VGRIFSAKERSIGKIFFFIFFSQKGSGLQGEVSCLPAQRAHAVRPDKLLS
jgi:hypothetical protein